MIKYLLLILLFLSYLLYNNYCNERFENKLTEYKLYINKNDKNCDSYSLMLGDNLLVESHNKNEFSIDKCSLKSIVSNNFNNNTDEVEISRNDENCHEYNIFLDGKKKQSFKFHCHDMNEFNLFDMNDNLLYKIYFNILNDKEIITIRNTKFEKYAEIKSNTFREFQKKKDRLTYDFQIVSPEFKNSEILAYSLFKIVKEIINDHNS